MGTHQTPPADTAPRRRPLTYDPRAEIVRAAHYPIVSGLSEATTWRYRRAGKLWPEIRLGENSVGARRRDIEAWLEARQLGAASGR